jgi:ADP-ribose pyrophosphatase
MTSERDGGRPFPPTDPECELCRADRFTHWYATTADGWVADCEVCSVPMVVWWDHGPDCGLEARERLLAALGAAADIRFGPGRWQLDPVMRQVPGHFHAHARDERWFQERFSRPLSRYTGVGGPRQTLPLLGSPTPTPDRHVDRSLDWEHLGSRYAEHLILFQTRYDQLRHPESGQVFERLVLESGDWVNCVALAGDGRLVMVRQFRFGSRYTTLETPGGMVDPGEDSLAAMRRELLEETGYSGGTWTYLGAVEPNPAFHDHLCHHWLARDVAPTQAPAPGTGEHLRVELMSAEAVVAAAREGVIRHALALSVLGRVLDLWPRPPAGYGPPEPRSNRSP